MPKLPKHLNKLTLVAFALLVVASFFAAVFAHEGQDIRLRVDHFELQVTHPDKPSTERP